jgi:hypothetical protein
VDRKRVEEPGDIATDAEKWRSDQITEPASAPVVPDAPDVATDAEKWRSDQIG